MRFGSIVQIVLFSGFLVSGTLCTLFIHMSPGSLESENRRLAPFPAYSLHNILSGDYFRQLDNYTADHIGFRESLVHSSAYIASLQGMTGRDSVLIVPSDANNTAEAPKQLPVQSPSMNVPNEVPMNPPAVSQQAVSPDKPPLPEVKGKVQGKVLIMGDRAVDLFSYDPASGQAYAQAINRIQNRIDQSISHSVQTTVLLSPTAVEFISSDKLRTLSDSEKDAIDAVYRNIRTDIKKVDALSAMGRHSKEQLFFRTDHHWTAAGAYYAYSAYMQAIGMYPVPLSTYDKGEVTDFLGSLYASTLNRQLAAHPDTVIYYKPYVKHRYFIHYTGSLEMPLIDLSHANKKNKYRIFLSGDRPWGEIVTQVDNDRILMVVKDSYGNALVPFLLPHYHEIYVVDPRQFNQPIIPFIQEHHIRDILYVNNAEAVSDRGFADQLSKLVSD